MKKYILVSELSDRDLADELAKLERKGRLISDREVYRRNALRTEKLDRKAERAWERDGRFPANS